ncbi:hypothetical protein ES703_04737 [subsurface metagenome]
MHQFWGGGGRIKADPTLILFLGDIGGTPGEEMVAFAHRAIARDVIERALESGAFSRVILVTDVEELGKELGPSVVVEESSGPFHFGQKLKQVIQKHGIEKPFYIGRGSVPLLSSGELGALAQQLSSATNTVITNNIFSADLIAFTPGKAIADIDLPAIDNPLAQLLVGQAGLREVCLPRTAAYQFDIDTPADLFILKLHPGVGSYTQACVAGLDLDTSRLERVISCFNDENAQVVVAGRVGSHVWSQMETGTACRVRLLAEERSLRADERQRRGEACSILGFYWEQVTPQRFFETLARLGDAAFIDSRVIFAHFGLEPSRPDRFYSDLGQPEKIDNPFVRQFTEAALGAPIPVILGGHSLVSGGLLALIEIGLLTRK